MAERMHEIRDYCAAYCDWHRKGAIVPTVAPLLLRLDCGKVVFGFYCNAYNAGRAASMILRKASIHDGRYGVTSRLEEDVETNVLEAGRVVADHVASWCAVDPLPEHGIRLLHQLEAEAGQFQRELTGSRNLKPRIEQDIRNYGNAHYRGKALVPMIFELGRAGIVFGFADMDSEAAAARSTQDTILLQHGVTMEQESELWDLINRTYRSNQQVQIALDKVVLYYSLMDMQFLGSNEKARELVARIPDRPEYVAEAEAGEAPTGREEENYLKLWGWQLPVRKNLMPEVLTQDVDMTDVADGLGRVSTSARRVLTTELRNPFRSRKKAPPGPHPNKEEFPEG